MKVLEAKSIHIFAWPFFINDKKSETYFKKNLNELGWERKILDCHECGDNINRLRECFMVKQYFSNSAENIFLNENTKACTMYTYPLYEKHGYKYLISSKDDEKKSIKNYELDVEEIELHIYDYGVGILFFKLLNMDDAISMEDIKVINDLGRRVSLPFLPVECNDFILTAEKLGIIGGTGGDLVTNYRELAKEAADHIDKLLRPADFIEYTLNVNLDKGKEEHKIRVTFGADKPSKKVISVTPMTDDRMFTMALIRDDEWSQKLADKNVRESVDFKENLYAVTFLDKTDATCQHEGMRDELLEEACYKRWLDYGTLHAVTGYSYLCITAGKTYIDKDDGNEKENVGVNNTVVKPFYLEYLYFISLVLAQRICILKFSANSEILAEKMMKKRGVLKLIPKGISFKLVELQERYISFINRMLILEVSTQEQGVELYQLLQKQLRVEAEKGILDEQMHGMYEAVNTSNSSRMGWWGLVWALLSVIVAIITYILTT